MSKNKIYIPVVAQDGTPLMPTTPKRADKLIKRKEATPFFKLGQFCIRLNRVSELNTQHVVLGYDPGSSFEACTVKSRAHTYLNIQHNAIEHVKDRLEDRSSLRRGRRGRKTPYRKPRFNNRSSSKTAGRLPPSTKARWDLKLGIIKKLSSVMPIADIIVEDIAARTRKGKDQRRWNGAFSPLEQGKKYFKSTVESMGLIYHTKQGYFTADLRNKFSLIKGSNKKEENFSTHAVDSYVLANHIVGGHTKPDNTTIHVLRPVVASKRGGARALHRSQPGPNGKRAKNGGTQCLGFKRSSIVNHSKFGHVIIAGSNGKRLSITNLSGKHPEGKKDNRINQSIKPEDCKFVAYNRFYHYIAK